MQVSSRLWPPIKSFKFTVQHVRKLLTYVQHTHIVKTRWDWPCHISHVGWGLLSDRFSLLSNAGLDWHTGVLHTRGNRRNHTWRERGVEGFRSVLVAVPAESWISQLLADLQVPYHPTWRFKPRVMVDVLVDMNFDVTTPFFFIYKSTRPPVDQIISKLNSWFR